LKQIDGENYTLGLRSPKALTLAEDRYTT
jgi:hypothetical protein